MKELKPVRVALAGLGVLGLGLAANTSTANADSPSQIGIVKKVSETVSEPIIEKFIVYTGKHDQTKPLIGGENNEYFVAQNVVRNADGSATTTIHGLDLETGQPFPIALEGKNNYLSNTSGNFVSYTHDNDVRLFHLQAKTNNKIGEGTSPYVDGDNYYWIDNSGEIKGLKISTLEPFIISSRVGNEKRQLVATGDAVGWMEKRGEKWGFVFKRVSTGETLLERFSPTGDILDIAVSKDKVAFIESKEEDYHHGIAVWSRLNVIDINGRIMEIAKDRISLKTRVTLSDDGETIAWTERKVGESGGFKIAVLNFRTNKIAEIQTERANGVDAPSVESDKRVSGKATLLYSDRVGGDINKDADLLGATLHFPPAHLVK